MKKNNMDSIFGNQDKNFQELIDSQADTCEKLETRQNDHNTKKFVKSMNLRQRNIGNRKIGKK